MCRAGFSIYQSRFVMVARRTVDGENGEFVMLGIKQHDEAGVSGRARIVRSRIRGVGDCPWLAKKRGNVVAIRFESTT